MAQSSYYIFWEEEELELRLINENGIFKPNTWDMIGMYRDNRLFEFYQKNKAQLFRDSIPESNWLHYPYVDIQIIINDSAVKLHLPNGINSSENSMPYQLARLIESTLFNVEQGSSWEQAEKKMKYFPKNHDRLKKNGRTEKLKK